MKKKKTLAEQTLTLDQQLILIALSHQGDGYLAAPHAACFAQFRIEAAQVEADLVALADRDEPLTQLSSVTEQYLSEEDEVIDEIVVDHGWEITPAGRSLVVNLDINLDTQEPS